MSNCYELIYPNGEAVDNGDCMPHFPTKQRATEDASRYTEPNLGTPTPREITDQCHTIGCSQCHAFFDEDDAVTYHFDSRAQGLKMIGDWNWRVDGDTATCPGCIEEAAVSR